MKGYTLRFFEQWAAKNGYDRFVDAERAQLCGHLRCTLRGAGVIGCSTKREGKKALLWGWVALNSRERVINKSEVQQHHAPGFV